MVRRWKSGRYLSETYGFKPAGVTYRLNLYRGSKLTSSEIVEAPLEQAKGLATAACDSGQAHRAKLVSDDGSIIFQRWAVL